MGSSIPTLVTVLGFGILTGWLAGWLAGWGLLSLGQEF
jgi:hypothetical protein